MQKLHKLSCQQNQQFNRLTSQQHVVFNAANGPHFATLLEMLGFETHETLLEQVQVRRLGKWMAICCHHSVGKNQIAFSAVFPQNSPAVFLLRFFAFSRLL